MFKENYQTANTHSNISGILPPPDTSSPLLILHNSEGTFHSGALFIFHHHLYLLPEHLPIQLLANQQEPFHFLSALHQSPKHSFYLNFAPYALLQGGALFSLVRLWTDLVEKEHNANDSFAEYSLCDPTIPVICHINSHWALNAHFPTIFQWNLI